MLENIFKSFNENGLCEDVFVIAEVGINHDGDFAKAKKLIESASESGASAVKLQTYITEKRVALDSPIYDILKKCELSFKQQEELFVYAKSLGIEIFSTPFDEESVDFLNDIGCSCFKVASFDLVNKKLLEKIAETKKPVIMSRGMANKNEIDAAMKVLEKDNLVALLHCISAYPVKAHTDLNLSTINELVKRYNCPVGFSDHTIGIEAAQFAVAAGACIVEKHFTLSNTDEGPDHALSTEPSAMKEMVEKIKYVREMLGKPAWDSIDAEKDILQYRRAS